MDPMIAIAFLYRMLTYDQREKLAAYMVQLPLQRYLTGFEISRLFNLRLEAITQSEEEQMKKVAAEFSKILWKKRILEYKAENPNLSDEDLAEVVDGKIGAEDLEEWQHYAAAHYQQPSGGFKELSPEYVGGGSA